MSTVSGRETVFNKYQPYSFSSPSSDSETCHKETRGFVGQNDQDALCWSVPGMSLLRILPLFRTIDIPLKQMLIYLFKLLISCIHKMGLPWQLRWYRICLQCRRPGFEKEMATHSSILAQKIPWTEDPGGLQSMESQESRHFSG